LKSVDGLFHQKEKIPEEWDYVELEKLTDEKSAIRMGPFGSSLKKEELVGKGIMTLWIENIVNNEFSWDYKQYITKEKFEELRGFEVKPDDVLITMMGTVGRVAIVPKDIGTAIITSHLLKITLDQKKCLPKFLYYFLQSYFIHRQLLRESRGIVMSGLNTEIIKSLLIKVPKLPEQKKIALILSNIDELILKQQQVIEQTQKLMKGQMQKLLTKGINHTKFSKRPWLFGKKIEIPVEWELKRIKDVTEVSVGLVINPSTYFDDNGTVPMITGKNVTENGIVLDKVDFISEKSNKLLDKTRIWSGDLVTMRVGYPGRTSLVKDEHDGINCASVIITRKSKKIDSQFLYYLSNSELISKQVTKYEAGSAQKVINIDSWENFLIPFPPLPEQQKIASILSNLDLLIQQEKQYKEKLQKIKRGLMQQLLTGKTRVKV